MYMKTIICIAALLGFVSCAKENKNLNEAQEKAPVKTGPTFEKASTAACEKVADGEDVMVEISKKEALLIIEGVIYRFAFVGTSTEVDSEEILIGDFCTVEINEGAVTEVIFPEPVEPPPSSGNWWNPRPNVPQPPPTWGACGPMPCQNN